MTDNFKLKQVSQPYVNASDAYNKRRDELEQQIEQLQQELKELHSPGWIEDIIEGIAKELLKHYPKYTYEILGPFGMDARTSIWLRYPGAPPGNELKPPYLYDITFVPLDLGKGEIAIENTEVDTGRFADGTIGEVNGMNHPKIPLTPETTIEEILEWVK